MAQVTAATIIGHDLYLLSWCLQNARLRAGMEHDWLVFNWIPAETPEVAAPIKDWCQKEGVKYVPWTAPPKPRENVTEWFLHCLYYAWNALYQEADTEWVARLGSDQFFSKGWLRGLWRAQEKHGARSSFHCWTVESPAAKHSRHDVQDWGTTWQTFDHPAFEQYASNLIASHQDQIAIPGDECKLMYRHPTRGFQHRADGCSWLQTKALWEEFGPMSDKINAEGVTGDVSYHDKLTDAGIPAYLVPISCTYHLVASESRSLNV